MSKIENPTYKAPEEEMSLEEIKEREEEAERLLRRDAKSSEGKERAAVKGEIETEGYGEQLEQNELVRVRGEEGKWYFLGGGDEKSLISSLPDTPENVDNAKVTKWVKTADLKKA